MPDVIEVKIPDLGNITSAEVIEIAVQPGDTVQVDEILLTLESDKASMDIPSPAAGTVKALKVQLGDKLAKDDLILLLALKTDQASSSISDSSLSYSVRAEAATEYLEDNALTRPHSIESKAQLDDHSYEAKDTDVYAGPAVRRIARESGIDLRQVAPTGPKGRILIEDLQIYLDPSLNKPASTILPTIPAMDFSLFGKIETRELSRIKKYSGKNLHRNWVSAPHVTQFGEADVTEVEAFRKAKQSSAENQGIKLTLLAFIMKALITTLKAFPQFNASLSPDEKTLIIKKYIHLGIAVDTQEGLVVPVIQNADKKEIFELAKELAIIGNKARSKQLTASDMQGNSFTLSSLGGIDGATHFTPIINLPDVAILGISRARLKPVYQDREFLPRLLLPLSLSYDHRVIDGAEGAYFMAHLIQHLTDVRCCLL